MKNKDNEIIEELKKITKNRNEMNKAYKRINFAMWAILICNFIAGCFIGSIYFIMNEIIYLIIGIAVILLDVPAYFILNKIKNKIKSYNSNQ